MADRPDLALEAVTLAEQHGEADAAPVVEHGKPDRDRTGIAAGSGGERGAIGVRLELRRGFGRIGDERARGEIKQSHKGPP